MPPGVSLDGVWFPLSGDVRDCCLPFLVDGAINSSLNSSIYRQLLLNHCRSSTHIALIHHIDDSLLRSYENLLTRPLTYSPKRTEEMLNNLDPLTIKLISSTVKRNTYKHLEHPLSPFHHNWDHMTETIVLLTRKFGFDIADLFSHAEGDMRTAATAAIFELEG
jgi:hypothetical protein